MPQTAKLFRNGRSQAVRLPAQFRFEGQEVLIRRDERTGDVILSEKAQAGTGWDGFFSLRDKVSASGELDDFALERDDKPAERDDPLR